VTRITYHGHRTAAIADYDNGCAICSREGGGGLVKGKDGELEQFSYKEERRY
jgi:hypothetical protein